MKKLSALLILISLSVFFIYSCQKDKTYEAGESDNLRTTVTGIVLDESNAALSGVTVTAYGQTTTTNQYGTFVLKNLNANKDRCVLEFSKTGFFKRAHGFIASANTVNYVRIILISNTSSQNFSSSTGGTVSLTDGSSAEFQPNSFVISYGTSYTGTVNIAIKHLSADDANFGFMIPGGDLLGKNLNDEDVALFTYGMLGVELTGSNGEALQLAAGSPATLTFSIAASQLSSAPASIPLWYFDETTSLWKEEGAANKVGNNYVGTVAHFSWWNCDISANSPLIKGKVIDCQGNPVANCVVTVNWATTLTNQNGEWQGQVPSGMTLTVQVLTSNNPWLTQNSQLENVPALINNQTFIVPDLIVSCATKIIGNIIGCSNEVIDGLAIVIENGSLINYSYTTQGVFNFFTKSNTSQTLKTYASFVEHDTNIVTTSPGTTFNAGYIQHCDTMGFIPENSFVLNGDGFNNKLVTLDSLTSSEANYHISGGNTYCHNVGSGNSGYCVLYLYFPGNIPGIFNLPGTSGYVDGYIMVNNKYYQGSNSGNNNHLEINVLNYGPVGELISGTFEGALSRWDSTIGNWAYINISNGKFSYTRGPDGNRYAAPPNIKDDIAYWNKKFHFKVK